MLCVMKSFCLSLPSLLLHVGHSVTPQGGRLVRKKMDEDGGAMGKRSDGEGVLEWGRAFESGSLGGANWDGDNRRTMGPVGEGDQWEGGQ